MHLCRICGMAPDGNSGVGWDRIFAFDNDFANLYRSRVWKNKVKKQRHFPTGSQIRLLVFQLQHFPAGATILCVLKLCLS